MVPPIFAVPAPQLKVALITLYHLPENNSFFKKVFMTPALYAEALLKLKPEPYRALTVYNTQRL
jgi:hypothetical protein